MVDKDKDKDVDVSEFLHSYRCEKCNCLFFKADLNVGYIEILCPRCGFKHKIKVFNGSVSNNLVRE